jgi:DNA (cytosine-5)-methyltransferase 1
MSGDIMKKTVVELFAGVGGFRAGLNNINGFDESGRAIENGDWEFVWANQWEPATKSQPAFDCYTTRFGDSPNHVNEDIGLIDKKEIPDHTLLVGGFPCQDYSVARGLSGEKGIEGKKGVLWWQIYETLEAKRPPFVLLENVDRLLKSPSKQRGRDFGIMLRGLYDLGYGVEWRVINAGDYGMPQRRRRVFIFTFHNTTKYFNNVLQQSFEDNIYHNGLFAKSFEVDKITLSKHKPKQGNLKDFKDIFTVSDNFSEQFRNSGTMVKGKYLSIEVHPVIIKRFQLKNILDKKVANEFYLNKDQAKRFEYLKGYKKVLRKRPNGEPYFYSEGAMAFPENLELPGRTMLTSESSVNRSTHVVQVSKTAKLRFITPIEAERLNTFPENWTNTGMTTKQRYFMMGNALVVDVIKRIEDVLTLIIKKEE